MSALDGLATDLLIFAIGARSLEHAERADGMKPSVWSFTALTWRARRDGTYRVDRNQSDRTAIACTVFAAAGMLARVTNVGRRQATRPLRP